MEPRYLSSIDQFDVFDKYKRQKFKRLRIKEIGLSDIKMQLVFDLACKADDQDMFKLDTPRKAKRSLDTDTDTEDLPVKRSKPTEPTERTEFTGRLNRPTNKHIVELAAGGIDMDVSNIDDILNHVYGNMIEEHSFPDTVIDCFLEGDSIIKKNRADGVGITSSMYSSIAHLKRG